jgi:hypothetical protein
MILCKTMQSTEKTTPKNLEIYPQKAHWGYIASPIFKCFEIKLTLTSIKPCRRTMQGITLTPMRMFRAMHLVHCIVVVPKMKTFIKFLNEVGFMIKQKFFSLCDIMKIKFIH